MSWVVVVFNPLLDDVLAMRSIPVPSIELQTGYSCLLLCGLHMMASSHFTNHPFSVERNLSRVVHTSLYGSPRCATRFRGSKFPR